MAKLTDFKVFFLSLDNDEREAFASEAGTTVGYIKAHLIAPPLRRKIPRPDLLDGLTAACANRRSGPSRTDLLQFFYAKDQAA